MSSLFSKYVLNPSASAGRRSLELCNRVVIAPMCQYSADIGRATDWHLMHWGNMLNSGAALFIIEATAVSPEARISPACLGLWDDSTEQALSNYLYRSRRLAPPTPVFIQLAHAGRKASTVVPWIKGDVVADNNAWQTLAPSPIPFYSGKNVPKEMTEEDMKKVVSDFVAAAKRSKGMGIDGIEIHSAHGYLLHEFLSPVSNKRTDRFGGSRENRMRFPLEVFSAVRESYDGILGLRLSATDWIEGGWSPDDAVEYVSQLKLRGCDFVHVSSGGISLEQKIKLGRNYQVPFAKRIKEEVGLPTIAVGLITDPQQAEDVVASGEADFVALARAVLFNPRWGWAAAAALKVNNGQVDASPQFWRCPPRGAEGIFNYTKQMK
jgi:2,4-dienoyl-CoA reductase-like NADH-dependent reductase (Old Yellow Enzyme family)